VAAASGFVTLLLTTVLGGPATAVDRPVVVPEVPVTATDLRRTEANNSPTLAVDPTDSRFVALAHRADAPEFSCGLDVSGDGGKGWVSANPVRDLPEGAERCYAPEIAFDRRGRLYYLFVGLAGTGNRPIGVFLTSSSDHAQTFTAPRRVLDSENYQVRMAIDPSVGARGRIHLVWLHSLGAPSLGGLPPEPNPILAAHSDDGGDTFSTPMRVSDPGRLRSVAPVIALGPDRTVHVGYFDLQDDAVDYQGLEGAPWPGDWSVVVATSHDGGDRFEPGVVVDDQLLPPGRVMLIFTMPPPSLAADRSGNLYAGWFDARHGDPDAFFARSPDGGRTWDKPHRLNDDPIGNGTAQLLTRVSVAPNGRVDTIFFDRRDDQRNLFDDVYFTWSTDGGRHFAPNVKLTTKGSDSRVGQAYLVPSAKDLVELGSRLALVSRSDMAVAAWPDSRNATLGSTEQDVFATQVVFGRGSPFPWAAVLVIGGATVVLGVAVVVAKGRRRAA
jgi:hypothetical protein